MPSVAMRKNKSIGNALGVLHERRKLLVIAHQHKRVAGAQGPKHNGFCDLPGFIHHAVVEAPAVEDRVAHPQTGGGNELCILQQVGVAKNKNHCLLYTSPSPRDRG